MKFLTWQNPEQLFVAQELINKVKSKCCGIKDEHRRKKADFMRRFRASREGKAEYIAQMEKRMRDDYRRRTGKEAESFCVL